MRVKSFLVSFLFVCSVFQLSAETVTLKTYPTIQTDPERNLKNAEMKLVYDTDDKELYMFFVEDYGWVSRYWFEVGRYGRKKIGKILAKAEEWATAAKSGHGRFSQRAGFQKTDEGIEGRGEKEKRPIKIEINIPVGNL